MKRIVITAYICVMLLLLWGTVGCGLSQSKTETIPKEQSIANFVDTLKTIDEVISAREINNDVSKEIEFTLFQIKYKSGECEVLSFLAVPDEFLDSTESIPCVIYNRGGNRDYGINTSDNILKIAYGLDSMVFASQYRGSKGSTGEDEFGGADLQDVIGIIDICEKLPLVDMDRLYMMGGSRGGMMTYMACRQDTRIKKAVVVSGASDLFMTCEERADMRALCEELIGSSPEQSPSEYEKRSATYWPDEINCPVLIIHSEKDKQVSYAQAEKMAKCLEQVGADYEFVSYDDDKHGYHEEDWKTIREWLLK